MGAINIKHTGSGGSVSLSSDGTSLLLDGTAIGGGGADLYAAETTGSSAPSAGGTRSLAIGSGASSAGSEAIAIGVGADAQGGSSVAIGDGAVAGTYSVSIGWGTADIGSNNTLIGRISTSSYRQQQTIIGHNADGGDYQTGNTAVGFDAKAMGNYSTALGQSYASGQYSFAAAIADNTSSYGATGANSIAMGYQAKATQANGIAIGDRVVATGNPSIAVGRQITASGTGSAAFGINYSGNNIASGENSLIVTMGGVTASGKKSAIFGGYSKATAERSFALGTNAASDSYGKFAFSAKGFNQDFYVDGSAQAGLSILSIITTDATSAYLSGSTGATITNQIILPNNSAYAFSGMIVARQDPATGTACAAWKVEGLIRREANAASTVLVNSALTILDNTPAWDITLTADTTVGALKITATGAAATTIRWVATINTAEVNFLN